MISDLSLHLAAVVAVAVACAAVPSRAMDRSEKEDRMKRAEQKRKEEDARRRCERPGQECKPPTGPARLPAA